MKSRLYAYQWDEKEYFVFEYDPPFNGYKYQVTRKDPDGKIHKMCLRNAYLKCLREPGWVDKWLNCGRNGRHSNAWYMQLYEYLMKHHGHERRFFKK